MDIGATEQGEWITDAGGPEEEEWYQQKKNIQLKESLLGR